MKIMIFFKIERIFFVEFYKDDWSGIFVPTFKEKVETCVPAAFSDQLLVRKAFYSIIRWNFFGLSQTEYVKPAFKSKLI